MVFIEVVLDRAPHDAMNSFKAAVRVRPEILCCHLTAGGVDHLIKTRVVNMRAYSEFVDSVAMALPGVQETRTCAVTEVVKHRLAGYQGDAVFGSAVGDLRRRSWPGPEYRRTHTHDGGALRNRRLEIGCHTHRQRIECKAVCVQHGEKLTQGAVRRALSAKVQ
jgi:Lrp/AsnC ligand binding domain